MSAQEILRLIEAVDPSNTAKLDEIDARVWCCLNNKSYEGMSGSHHMTRVADRMYKCGHDYLWLKPHNCSAILEYTRSRDALKSIRPEGWFMNGYYALACGTKLENSNYQFSLEKVSLGHGYRCVSKKCPTEELAELHAIIQAIEYERMTPSPETRKEK